MKKTIHFSWSHPKGVQQVLTLLLGLLCFFPFQTYAGCSPWMDKAVLNEYTYGSTSTNYIETYSDWGSFPAAWPGWKIRYYQRNAAMQEFTYTYGNSNVSACTASNKTYLRQGFTQNTLSGNSPAVIELLDANGDVVDAMAINIKANNSGQLVSNSGWRTNTDNATIVNGDGGLASRCPTLANRLSADYSSNGGTTAWATTNMISASGSASNKAYARQTDGRVGLWGESLLGGNNTTFTNCSTNNFNLAKTVNVPGAAAGGKVKFTLTLKNAGSTTLSNITVTDTVAATPPSTEPTYTPPALTFTLAGITASTGSGTPTLSGNTITWNIPNLASGSTATLVVEATIPSTAKSGTVYTNTATSSNFNPVQTDSASVTVVPATTKSFLVIADKYSACTADTATSATKAPLVTITAMSGLSGTGSRVTSFTGKVFLSTSSGNGTWSLGPGASGILSGNEYIFHENDQGQVKLYLADTTSESIYISAVTADGSSPDSAVTAGQTPSEITYSSARLTIDNVDSIIPAGVTVIAGRSNQMRATLTSCSGSAAPTGSALRAWYTPSSNHGSSSSIYLSTSSSCSTGLIQLLPAAPATSNATSIVFNTASSTTSTADFYLCTSDVGQFQVNLAVPNSQGASSYQTVRPLAITASGIKVTSSPTTLNPGVATATGSKFAAAGTAITMKFDAWKYASTIGGVINANGSLNTSAKGNATPYAYSQFSAAGSTSGFASSAIVKASLNTPSGGTTGYLRSTVAGNTEQEPSTSLTIPLAAGTRTLTDVYYTEVGSFKLEGASNTSSIAVENFLGESGVNVPLIVFDKDDKWTTTSDVVGRFTPSYFELASGSKIENRYSDSSACTTPASRPAWSYMDEAFKLTFTLKAMNAVGNPTSNYTGDFARLGASNWVAKDAADSLGVGALGVNIAGIADCRAVLFRSGTSNTVFEMKNGATANAACSGIQEVPASASRLAVNTTANGNPTVTWTAGSGTFAGYLQLDRASQLDGPYTLNFGIWPTDADSVTMNKPSGTVTNFDADNNGTPERVELTGVSTTVRYGRLRMENAYGSERLPLRITYRTQFFQSTKSSLTTAAGWQTSADDSCTLVPVPTLGYSATSARNKLTSGNVVARLTNSSGTVTSGTAQIEEGGSKSTFSLRLTGANANVGPGLIGYVDLSTISSGVDDATPAYLRFKWDGTNLTGPKARAIFGTYRNPIVFTRELY
ncbi:DUF6701 domain-containing protein [Noviherbaspirillum sp. ST9]|uniref:DUF6701 domain-containing protein n=1 Tax=Noviherbaspirillum sp. ST9 TaxID=3401606 RepID=UPI003B58B315